MVRKRNTNDLKKTIVISLIYVFIISTFLAIQKIVAPGFKAGQQYADKIQNQGKVALALEHYKRLVKVHPYNSKIHLKLGQLYQEVKEKQKAKIEIFRAMKTCPKGDFEAHFAMADLYLKNKESELAEDLVEQLKGEELKQKKYKVLKAKFYADLGDHYAREYPEKSLRLLKKAHKIYEEYNCEEIKDIKEQIARVGVSLANTFIGQEKGKEAFATLKNALKYSDSPKLHNKLAILYEPIDIKKSIQHSKRAYELDKSNSNKDNYYMILRKASKIYKKKGEKTESKYYEHLAEKVKPKIVVPTQKDFDLLVNIFSMIYNEEKQRPGISFNVTNVNKDKLEYLKCKVEFIHKGNVVDETVFQIADKNRPIKGDSRSKQHQIYTNKSVDEKTLEEGLNIKIYLSKANPDKWEVYRNMLLKAE